MNRLNKVSLGAALLVVSASTLAYDGTVNFNGEITDNTCVVSLGENANSMIVPMGSVNASSFTGRGSIASTTLFVLTLTDCPSINARVKFDGSTYEGDQEVLALSPGAGVAGNIGIQLYDQNMTKVPLYTASSVYELKENEVNKLKFYASYIAMANTVSPGPANAVANFTMNYN